MLPYCLGSICHVLLRESLEDTNDRSESCTRISLSAWNDGFSWIVALLQCIPDAHTISGYNAHASLHSEWCTSLAISSGDLDEKLNEESSWLQNSSFGATVVSTVQVYGFE